MRFYLRITNASLYSLLRRALLVLYTALDRQTQSNTALSGKLMKKKNMPTRKETKACWTCAKSKRKCGRTMPSCARCIEKRVPCVYPRSTRKAESAHRPLLSKAGRTPGLHPTVIGDETSLTTNLFSPDEFQWDSLLDFSFSSPLSQFQIPTATFTRTEFFLAPEAWEVTHDENTSKAAALITKATMKKYVAEVQSWLQRWITEGANPFIHPRMYSTKSPVCLQLAHATLASYIHRTPDNTDAILQSVEDRLHELVMEHDNTVEAHDVDGLFGQLARLHALLVYQIIGLFDGDIRCRHVTEFHIDVQSTWAMKLFHSASTILPKTTMDVAHLFGALPDSSTPAQQQWYLWILSESIRRTWLVAGAVSAIFLTLQQRRAICPGSIQYTARSGLWNASSAIEWERNFSGRDVAFLHGFESPKLFVDTKPADVDEFGTALLNMTAHREMLEKWKSKAACV
ncbi:unnamed protein product [Periconia digitata]|uniref:Zn(2)-C6 fungal-type domain-containing protein n=1 Tax=Periconia digitata TaxID=1303443 RepID=A0A9W4UNV7_9PLEO|nr:unnamed protein product [Periconia digitata]